MDRKISLGSALMGMVLVLEDVAANSNFCKSTTAVAFVAKFPVLIPPLTIRDVKLYGGH